MPFPRSQLDLIIVLQSSEFDEVSDSICSIKHQFEERKWFFKSHVTPMGIQELQLGDRAIIRFELSQRIRLFANHQGGYRVFCPICNAFITGEFSNVVSKWRVQGGLPKDRSITCTSCRSQYSLADCIGKPEFAFGFGAIHLVNVDVVQLPSILINELNSMGIKYKTVLKRVG